MAKRKVGKASTMTKCTFSIRPETDEKLSVEARRLKMSKSALATMLLSRGLSHIVISIRGQNGETESAA